MPACRWCPTPAIAWCAPPSMPASPWKPCPVPRLRSPRWPLPDCPPTPSTSAAFRRAKPGQPPHLLEALAEEQATLIFYEAPHRILESLEAVETVLGPRPVVVARELTKIHEEYLRGTAAEVRRQ